MQLQDYLFECTVRVEADDRVGTGFFVAPGLIVTAAHLVEDPLGGDFPLREVAVSSKGQRVLARVVRYAASPEPDLAVLELDEAGLGAATAAYMYASHQEGDGLYACGVGDSGSWAGISIDPSARDAEVLRLDGPIPTTLEGAPVLDLRSGAVTAVVTAATPVAGSLTPGLASATSVAVLARLFPDVWRRHDAYHEEHPGWFAATGVRGTVFAAREHMLATRDTCQTPIQPLITPVNGRLPMALLAPVAFQSPSVAAETSRLPPRIEDVLALSRARGRSVLLTGPTGSGRSSVLRALGEGASAAFGNLGALDQGERLFPILLRANQLATDDRAVEDVLIESMERGNEVMTGIDLPERFLSDLASSPGLRLLLMIDGMDEIQNSREIAELVDLIGRIQKAPGFGHRTQLLVTARPSAREHFRYAPFDVAEIQPLGETAIRQAAERWLGDAAEGFLSANAQMVASGLLSSPLVLSVALKLYESEPGRLPGKVVELYRTLISKLATQRRDELAGKYGAEVADNAVDLLGFVALELLRSGTVMDETWVRTTAGRYLSEHLGLESGQVETAAASFTHFAAADSHFIGPAGSLFFWSHLSFRDYFAASCLVRLSGSTNEAAQEIRRRWFDSNWGRTPSFALQLLDDENVRLEVIGEVLGSSRAARFAFMTDLLREGAELPDGLVTRFLEALVAEVRTERERGPENGLEPATLDFLLSLSHIPEARSAAAELAAPLPG